MNESAPILSEQTNDLLAERPREASPPTAAPFGQRSVISPDRLAPELGPAPATGQRSGDFPISHNSPSSHTSHSPQWYCAADIARALGTGWYKKRVSRLARQEKWPARRTQNRDEYQPPADIARFIVQAPAPRGPSSTERTVLFSDLVGAHFAGAREKVLMRQKAVLLLDSVAGSGAPRSGVGKELALQLVVSQFRQDHPLFPISVRSLRRWDEDYRRHGLNGLVEQKRGRVGQRAFVRDLNQQELLTVAAAAVDYGHPKVGTSRGKLNVARAYRDLVASPTLTGPARAWAHGNHAAKQYVPPSVRAAIKQLAPQSAATLIQVGKRALDLDGPHSNCTYANCPPGHAVTADDMTANAYVWVEFPNENGWLLIRPQILASMDIGSLMWLNVRAVIRPRGQYTKDDVWGLLGDTLDKYGLFKIFVLEGGAWQSNVVIGHKTGTTDADRLGGLEALGCKIIHTRTPRGKIIEGQFNTLQSTADAIPGYCGRMEMKDCPEQTKKMLSLCRNGHAHPRTVGFMHFHDYCKHLETVMQKLNHERQDGIILRGRAPIDAWLETFGSQSSDIINTSLQGGAISSDAQTSHPAPAREFVPDKDKWLYRSSYNCLRVTRNGVRISVGTGKYQLHYTYSSPALESHRGSNVIVYWNDGDPDTDAVIYSIKDSKPHQFLCLAPRQPDLPRFGASREESAAEARRKTQLRNIAIVKSAALAPYIQRRKGIHSADPSRPIGQPAADAVGGGPDEVSMSQRIAAARAAAEAKSAKAAKAAKLVQRAIATAEDLSSLSRGGDPSDPSDQTDSQISLAELKQL